MLDAKWTPAVAVGLIFVGYLNGLLFSGFLSLSPDTLGAVYPARPMLQIAHAVALLPQALTVFLWYAFTSSRVLSVVGALKAALGALSVYITLEDEPQLHGFLVMLYYLSTVTWMSLLAYKVVSPVQQRRRTLAIAMAVGLLLSVHFQGRYLSGGSGQWKVVGLQLVASSIDAIFDLLAVEDFAGFTIDAGYTIKPEV